MMWMWMVCTALAGKLADGFQGTGYGKTAILTKAPLPDCQEAPGPVGAGWLCNHTLGELPVTVAFLVDEGVHFGFAITVRGQPKCTRLLEILQQAYGPVEWRDGGGRGNLVPEAGWKISEATGVWLDGDVAGLFDYDVMGDKCQFNGLSESAYRAVNARKAERARQLEEKAKRAADDL